MTKQKIDYLAIQKRIVRFRKRIELTQSEATYAIGKPRQWLANLESRRPMSIINAVILAQFYSVTLDHLILGKLK